MAVSLRALKGERADPPKTLTVYRASEIASADDEVGAALLAELADRRFSRQAEMAHFEGLCERYDNLYYPNTVTKGGADHRPTDETAKTPGMVHISLNAFAPYVDIPASLQSVTPIESVEPLGTGEMERTLAAAVEGVYFAWKEEEAFDLKSHRACVVKSLYGRTAAKVYWDPVTKKAKVKVIDNPRNLWLGWDSTEYDNLDWVDYAYRMSATAVMEKYGLDVYEAEFGSGAERFKVPYVTRTRSDVASITPQSRFTNRDWLASHELMVECNDYWYRKPKESASPKLGEYTEMETWNAIFVGNVMVKNLVHTEYEGQMPYVPLFNTYIPGVPDGKPEFYDIEHLIREKEERLSEGGQMVHRAIKGQYWQLTGPDAPDVVPDGVRPIPEEVIPPGAGNRIEAIAPWMPEFQLESYLSRLDREITDISGLNELLKGLAPATVLSSSKAITALVANYEARIRMKRDLFYAWRRDVWNLTKLVWSAKVPEMRLAFAQTGRLSIEPPSITPREDAETATMAANLVAAKLWSLKRGMDMTGVDDPEGEWDIVAEERTDATVFPADVQVQVALMSQLQQLQMQQAMAQQQQSMAQGAPSPEQMANDQRVALGGREGLPSQNGPGEGVQLPPEGLPPSGPGENFLAQTAIQGGEAQNRLLLQQPVAPEGEGGGGY